MLHRCTQPHHVEQTRHSKHFKKSEDLDTKVTKARESAYPDTAIHRSHLLYVKIHADAPGSIARAPMAGLFEQHAGICILAHV